MKRVNFLWLLITSLFFLGTALQVSADTVNYTYDDAGRLTEADYGDNVITYTYDPAGNLLQRTVTDKKNLEQFQLTLQKEGAGTGTVSSSPSGINCGADCTQDYNKDTDVTLTASASSGAVFAGWSGGGCSGTGSCKVTMTDDITITATFNKLQPGVLQFSSTSFSVKENKSSVTITVTRSGGSDGAVSVDCSTSNGTATDDEDYTAASTTLQWADGDTAEKTFTISIIDDLTEEDKETINLSLSNPSGGASLGMPGTAVVTISDNDSGGGGGGSCFISAAKK
jgi:YD repeat-containing protein